VYPGEVVTLALTGATDPSLADTTAGFTFAFACSDADALGTPSSAASHQCSYAVAGPQTARARIADKDGARDYTVTVTVASQLEGAAGLIEAVRALEASGALGGGNANALVAKLEGAIAQLEQGNVRPAVNKLGAFVNQVEAFLQDGTLSADVGQSLIDAAGRIITTLGS
jgi:hypothetical protein